MTKYRLYIDEVGNPDLKNSDDPNHRFLSLTGIIIDISYVEIRVHPDMERLKKKYFGSHPDDPVIMHRKEIVNRRYPFQALTNPACESAFNKELLELLREWEYHVLTVCLDKQRHSETYTTWRYDPYHYCLAVLLERFNFFLNRKEAIGDIMAESRAGKEDMRLKKSFQGIWEKGTQFVAPEQFQKNFTSKELKVRPK